MARTWLINVIIACIALGLTCAQPLTSPQWSNFHGPDGRTRAWPSELKTTTNGTVKWSYVADGPIGTLALSAQGVLYFLTCNNSLYAVDQNGTFLWKYTVSMSTSWCTSTPSVSSDGIVYVGFGNNTLYAFNGTNGRILWHQNADLTGYMSSPAVGADGSVYVGFGTKFCSFDGTRGTVQWCHSMPSAVDGPPILSRDGMVYTASSDGTVWAYYAATGVLVWKSNLGGITYGGPALDEHGALYVGIESVVYALNASNGSVLWEFGTGSYIDNPPSVSAEGLVYVGSEDGNAYALNATDGKLQWTLQTEGSVSGTPSISGGTVYAGSSDQFLYALHATSGALLWKFAGDGAMLASAAIGADGTLYAASCQEGSTLFAFLSTVIS